MLHHELGTYTAYSSAASNTATPGRICDPQLTGVEIQEVNGAVKMGTQVSLAPKDQDASGYVVGPS